MEEEFRLSLPLEGEHFFVTLVLISWVNTKKEKTDFGAGYRR